ncbi:MAG: hypothetical protein U0169_23055 [Polyangiaceae bacterium]
MRPSAPSIVRCLKKFLPAAALAALAVACSGTSFVDESVSQNAGSALTQSTPDDVRVAAPFITADELWKKVEEMVDLGPRHTASPAHDAFVDSLEAWMKRIGMIEIGRDTVTVTGPNGFTAPGAPTSGISHHLYGYLPGSTNEDVLLGVHSDGQNSVEENGTIVAMAIVEHLSKLPKSMRKRGVLVVFPTAHMASADSEEADGWVAAHPDRLKNVVAIVSPEHMGTISPFFRTPQDFRIWATSRALRDAATRATQAPKIPATTIASYGIGSAIIWRNATKLPTLGGMSIPYYLFDPSKEMEVLEKTRLHQQAESFRRIMLSVDAMSKADLGD